MDFLLGPARLRRFSVAGDFSLLSDGVGLAVASDDGSGVGSGRWLLSQCKQAAMSVSR